MSSSSSTIRTRKFMTTLRSTGMLLARRRPCLGERVASGLCAGLHRDLVVCAAQSPTVAAYSSVRLMCTSTGDIGKGHCNNGWVIFEDYVLVIDANDHPVHGRSSQESAS